VLENYYVDVMIEWVDQSTPDYYSVVDVHNDG
jgi:hypothetical protein